MYKVFVAGHKGMVGSAICRKLQNHDCELITASRKELDLTSQNQVREFFNFHKFDQVYLAAAKVGGIYANNHYPAEFIYENLMIQNNVIHQSYLSGVKKLLFLGSSCIYPRLAPQPISEDSLLDGALEATNEPYAIAKISGIKTCESYNRQYGVDYRSIMPSNLYGLGDNYHSKNSHVIPALIRRFHEAKLKNSDCVTVWGSGSPRREFLYVDDMADAAIYIMNINQIKLNSVISLRCSHINVGSGNDISIRELASIISDVIGYSGKIVWDSTKPDGAPRKLMNNKLISSLGWRSKISLREGLTLSYEDYLQDGSRC
jgi:GDP-L-fucose synthase